MPAALTPTSRDLARADRDAPRRRRPGRLVGLVLAVAVAIGLGLSLPSAALPPTHPTDAGTTSGVASGAHPSSLPFVRGESPTTSAAAAGAPRSAGWTHSSGSDGLPVGGAAIRVARAQAAALDRGSQPALSAVAGADGPRAPPVR